MKQQNFKNHRRWVLGYHLIMSIAILALLIGSLVNLFTSSHENIYSASLIVLIAIILLFVFAFIQIKSTLKKNEKYETKLKQGPIITGVLLSALNPFFIIWWLTIGLKLISDAMAIWAFVGILIVFVLHIWMDFVWLGATAFLISKSKKIISNTNYKILILALSAILIYFGITFLIDVIN